MQRLYMILLGCTPPGRFTEQHDIFFGIADSLKALVPEIIASWPEAKGKIHIDAWREVTNVNGFRVEVVERSEETAAASDARLYFLNLGGYRENEFDEFHYKFLVAAESSAEAIKMAKQTAFYKHMGFRNATSKGATSHIDEKYAVDVDDLHSVSDILAPDSKKKYAVRLTLSAEPLPEDDIHLGYFILSKIV